MNNCLLVIEWRLAANLVYISDDKINNKDKINGLYWEKNAEQQGSSIRYQQHS